MKRLVLVIPAAVIVACMQSTGPTAAGIPQAPLHANIAGVWLDSTDGGAQVFPLFVTQYGDSIVMTDSSLTYVRSEWHGTVWWTRWQGGFADTTIGQVMGDSVPLCDLLFTLFCPNEIAYVRDRGTELALYPDFQALGLSIDTAGFGAAYVRGSIAMTDTIPPPDAPPPVQLAGVWVSDSVSLVRGSCRGVVQLGLVVHAEGASYQEEEWGRRCGTRTWSRQAWGTGEALPYPCTPADRCVLALTDTTADGPRRWTLSVASANTLVVQPEPAIVEGQPSTFIRDGGLSSGLPSGERSRWGVERREQRERRE